MSAGRPALECAASGSRHDAGERGVYGGSVLGGGGRHALQFRGEKYGGLQGIGHLGTRQRRWRGPVQNELTLRQILDGIPGLLAVMTLDGAVEDVNCSGSYQSGFCYRL